MSYSIEFVEEDSHLLAAITGEISSYDALSEKVRKVMEEAEKREHKRVLVDDRALRMNVDFYDAQCLAREIEEASMQLKGFRIACLCKPEVKASYRVFETNHQNRSFNFRAFMDLEAALDWLGA